MARKTKQNTLTPEELALLELEWRRRKRERAVKLRTYQRDPVGYCREYFPNDFFYPKLDEVMMSVADNPVTGVMSCNSSGKTWLAGRIIKWFLDAFAVDGTVEIYPLAAPPAFNLKRIWNEFEYVKLKYPDLFEAEIFEKKHEIGPKQGVYPIPLPEGASPAKQKESFAGKHARAMLFILDEANAIPEVIWKAMREAMSSGIVVRMIFFFNPRERTGPAYTRWTNGECNPIRISAFDHPNVITGKMLVEGPVTRAGVVSLINTDTVAMSEGEPYDEDNCFDLPDFLVGSVAVLPDGTMSAPLPPGPRRILVPEFNYIVLGRPPKAGVTQLIAPEWIAQARVRYDEWVAIHGDKPPEGVKPVMSLDVATEANNADNNSVCLRWGGFPQFHLWTGKDLVETEEEAARIYVESQAHTLYVDGTGIGWGVPTHLQKLGVGAQRVVVSEKPTEVPSIIAEGIRSEAHFERLYDQLLWALRNWLNPMNNTGAMLPPLDRLLDALYRLTYRLTLDNKIQVGRIVNERDAGSIRAGTRLKTTLGYSPDELWSLALTFAPDGGAWGVVIDRAKDDLAYAQRMLYPTDAERLPAPRSQRGNPQWPT